jgi:hypothetical protein
VNLKGYVRKSGRTTTRMPSSKSGNPRFLVAFDDQTAYPTAPDASCAYRVENSDLAGDVWVRIERGLLVDILPANTE